MFQYPQHVFLGLAPEQSRIGPLQKLLITGAGALQLPVDLLVDSLDVVDPDLQLVGGLLELDQPLVVGPNGLLQGPDLILLAANTLHLGLAGRVVSPFHDHVARAELAPVCQLVQLRVQLLVLSPQPG